MIKIKTILFVLLVPRPIDTEIWSAVYKHCYVLCEITCPVPWPNTSPFEKQFWEEHTFQCWIFPPSFIRIYIGWKLFDPIVFYSQFIQRRVSEYQPLSTNIVYVLRKIMCPDQIVLRSKSISKKSPHSNVEDFLPLSYWREISMSQLYSIHNLFKEDFRNMKLRNVHQISAKT